MSIETLLAFAVAIGFSIIHAIGPRLTFLQVVPRSVWLSAAGGVSVAYVFVHVLPELAEQQARFEQMPGTAIGAVEHHVYLLSLIGLGLFYGLERMAKSRARRSASQSTDRYRPDLAYRANLGAYALYNALIGYLLLHREEEDPRGLLIYAIAMTLHFVVNDHGLRADHGAVYDRVGRWLLAAAPLAGWAFGVAIPIPPPMIAALFGFLAGGVVLNVLKEELPENRESRFSAFASGAVLYTVLLLAT